MTFYWHENICRILIDSSGYDIVSYFHSCENWIIAFVIVIISFTFVALIWIFQMLFANGIEFISQHLRIFVIQKISDIFFFDRNVAIVHRQFTIHNCHERASTNEQFTLNSCFHDSTVKLRFPLHSKLIQSHDAASCGCCKATLKSSKCFHFENENSLKLRRKDFHAEIPKVLLRIHQIW